MSSATLKPVIDADIQQKQDASPLRIWDEEATEHNDVMQKTHAQLQPQFEKVLHACVSAIRNGRKILFFGNGGSAADAQHLATALPDAV